ncbi:MAG: DUF1573 domain-containing protein [Acidobacteriota bacterium]
MRRSSIALLVLLLAPTLAFAQATPRAVPVEPIADFEIVPRGEQIEHVFQIRNQGEASLEITSVRPACGCTVVDFDRSIAPGEIGGVRAKLDTTDFFGAISKSIAVFTNDPENPKVTLVMKAKVQPFIGALPGYARFNYVQGEPVRPISQILWSEDATDMEVVEVLDPYDFVDIQYRPATDEERNRDKPGKQWRVDINLQPNAPVGALREYVQIRTDHPKQQIVRIPLSGFVRPRSHVTPTELDFGQLDGEALPLRRTLHFTNFATNGIEVTGIETGDGLDLAVEPSDKQPGHRFKLRLTVGESMPKGAFDTTIKLQTSDPQKPVIEIPVKGTVI